MSKNYKVKNYPSISIIIPLYNVEPYIVDCLKSVAGQEYKGETECLIVDDCGTDNSLELAEEFVRSYSGPIKFKVLKREKNGGLSAARNTGIDNSTGEYVLFLDSDDELTPLALDSLSAPIDHFRYDFVIGDYITTGTEQRMPELLLEEGPVPSDLIFPSYLHRKWYMMAVSKLYKRQFLLDTSLRFKEGLLHEDELWGFQLAASASSMYVTKDTCYIYKVRPGSITTSQKAENRQKALIVIYKEFIKFINVCQIPLTYDLWNFLQNCFLNLLFDIRKNRTNLTFSNVYQELASQKINRKKKLPPNGTSIKHYIRDFHYILPTPLSIGFEKVLVDYLLRKK